MAQTVSPPSSHAASNHAHAARPRPPASQSRDDFARLMDLDDGPAADGGVAAARKPPPPPARSESAAATRRAAPRQPDDPPPQRRRAEHDGPPPRADRPSADRAADAAAADRPTAGERPDADAPHETDRIGDDAVDARAEPTEKDPDALAAVEGASPGEPTGAAIPPPVEGAPGASLPVHGKDGPSDDEGSAVTALSGASAGDAAQAAGGAGGGRAGKALSTAEGSRSPGFATALGEADGAPKNPDGELAPTADPDAATASPASITNPDDALDGKAAAGKGGSGAFAPSSPQEEGGLARPDPDQAAVDSAGAAPAMAKPELTEGGPHAGRPAHAEFAKREAREADAPPAPSRDGPADALRPEPAPPSSDPAAGSTTRGASEAMGNPSVAGATLGLQTAAASATTGATSAAPASGAAAPVPVALLGVEIASHAQAGRRRFDIRLDPPELGQIDVRLDVDRDGTVVSRLIAERAETLDLLRREALQLERALQDAGLKTNSQSMQFSLRDHGGDRHGARDDGPAPRSPASAAESSTPSDAAATTYRRFNRGAGGLDIRI